MTKQINIGSVMHGAEAEKINADRNRKIENALEWVSEEAGWASIETELDYTLLLKVWNQIDYSKITAWSMYRKRIIFGKSGKKRIAWEPMPELKSIQKIINRKILEQVIGAYPNSFGFAGGSTTQAIEPHLNSAWMLTMDIVKAFPNTTYEKMLKNLETLSLPRKVPEVIAKICAFPVGINCELVAPQGAPTSPLLFELVMREIDEELAKRAGNVEITYTRFADNFFFSGNDKQKLKLMKSTFISIINRSGYQVHKNIKIRDLSFPYRILGLNIINGKIYNTRDFKRRIRIVIFKIKKLFELGKEDEAKNMLSRFDGLMGWVQTETISESLAKQILEFREFLLQRNNNETGIN